MLHKTAIFNIASILSILLVMISCAQIVAPTGGPTDATAPKPVSMYPELYQTNFSDHTVAVKFDEYIDLADPKKNILISPYHPTPPKTKIVGKTLFIQQSEGLIPDKTYSIKLLNAVKDYREGNILPFFEFKFATGPKLDTQKLVIITKNALTAEPITGALVILHEDTTALRTKRYDYIGYSHNQNPAIDHLDHRSYMLTAIYDSNQNRKWDPGELIGYSHARVSHTTGIDTIAMYVPKPETIKWSINAVSNHLVEIFVNTNYLHKKWNYHYLWAENINSNTTRYYVHQLPTDSTQIIADGTTYTLAPPKLVSDSIKPSIITPTAKSRLEGIEYRFDTAKFWFTNSPKAIDLSKINLYINTVLDSSAKIDTAEGAILATNLKPKSKYTLSIPSIAMTPISDSIAYTFTTHDTATQITPIVTLVGSAPHRILFYTNDRGTQNIPIKPNLKVKLPQQQVGTKLKVYWYWDQNQNGYYDAGNMNHRTQPEPVYYREITIEKQKINYEVPYH